jgi:hypothetical protein
MTSSAPDIEAVRPDHDAVERCRRAPSALSRPLHAIVRGVAVGLLTTAAVLLVPTAAGATEPDPEVECTYDEGFWFWWLDLGQGEWECEPT